MRRTSQTVAAIGLTTTLVFGPALLAGADDHTGPPAHVLEKATAAVGQGRQHAQTMLAVAATRDHTTGLPEHAQGDPGHATGLARAQEAVAKAAGMEKSNNGHAYGAGHARDVHTALGAELSPSGLESHGDKVSNMVKTVESFVTDKPGLGLGRDKKGDA